MRWPIDEFEDSIGLHGLRQGSDFHTIAGFVLQHLGHLPTVGEGFDFEDLRVEGVDMDGRRIDKISIRPSSGVAPDPR